MKNVLIASLITLGSAAAFAQPISLQPGSSVVVNGDLVSCLAPENMNVPACSIKQDGSYYRVYAGNTIAQTYAYFDQAIDGVKQMKSVGLCR